MPQSLPRFLDKLPFIFDCLVFEALFDRLVFEALLSMLSTALLHSYPKTESFSDIQDYFCSLMLSFKENLYLL